MTGPFHEGNIMSVPAPFNFFKTAKKLAAEQALTTPYAPARDAAALALAREVAVPMQTNRPARARYQRGPFYLKIDGLTGPREKIDNSKPD